MIVRKKHVVQTLQQIMTVWLRFLTGTAETKIAGIIEITTTTKTTGTTEPSKPSKYKALGTVTATLDHHCFKLCL